MLIMLLNNITVIADDLIDNTNETPVVETTEATYEVEKEEVVLHVIIFMKNHLPITKINIYMIDGAFL